MKKILYSLTAIFLALTISLSFVSCVMRFGSKHVNDPQEYGKWESYINNFNISFLPKSIDNYQVNSYSYTLEAWLDLCFEIFLDISVSEEQFIQLIENAKGHPEYLYEKNAYYADGYIEIVFKDSYSINDDRSTADKSDVELTVGWADIEKVIYNPETLNIIYVCFHANDSDVYKLDEVAYFNRFSIDEHEYALDVFRIK